MTNGIGQWLGGEGRIVFGRWAVYGFFCVIGIMFFLLHVALGVSSPRLANIACGFGIAFIVGGVTGLIHAFYLQKELREARRDQEMEELGMRMQRNGLIEIFPKRPLVPIKHAIENAQKEIRIAGSTLKGLVGVDDPNDEQRAVMGALIGKVRRGVALKLLLAHPLLSGYRERMEGREKGHILEEVVRNLLRLLAELQGIGKKASGLWEIRLYKCGPSVFSLEVDDRVLFLEPYPLAGTSMDNLCILCSIPTQMGNNMKNFIDAHFHDAWDKEDPRGPVTVVQSFEEVGNIVKELAKEGCVADDQREMLEKLVERHKG